MQTTADTANTNPHSAALIALKPRQVLLAEHHKMTLAMTKKKQSQTPTLNPEQKAFLLHSVIQYLEKNGFSKTLKRFLSEAQIQNEDWKASSLDLEDLYCKYLDTCNHAGTNINTYKKEEGTAKEDENSNCAASEQFIKKKKKKRGEEGDSNVAEDQSEAADRKLVNSAKNSEELLENNIVSESKAKSKGKKKMKKSSDSPDQNLQVQSLVLKKHVENAVSKEMDELTKNKKKKKSTSIPESSVNNVDQEKIESVKEKSKDSASVVCDLKKEKKSFKKRKRLASDENEYQPVDNEANDETKRRKTKGLEESKKKDKLTVDDGGKESKQENGQVDTNESHKTSMGQVDEHANGDLEKNGREKPSKKQLNEHANGNLEKNGGKSASQKSTRKECNGSAEPKTVNAFQRVKIDEVVFADEKLQDNSYWAKDGSEVGYGAKAQEVLGQVRGRDFRHEKTKKKRGSYRGGLIDLQSHSVKFNYSDED